MKYRMRGLMLLAILTFAACAPVEIPFDRPANANIKTIAILDPGTPVKANVVLVGTIGQSMGLIGAIVDASIQQARETRFANAIAGQNFVLKEELNKSLIAVLNRHGYEARIVPVTRAKPVLLKSSDYKAITAQADAYLDVAVTGYGYLAAGTGIQPYRPVFVLLCRLIRASDQVVLMEDTIIYNPLNGAATQGVVTIPPDPAYAFVDSDTLNADPEKAVAGMRASLGGVTDTVGTLLR